MTLQRRFSTMTLHCFIVFLPLTLSVLAENTTKSPCTNRRADCELMAEKNGRIVFCQALRHRRSCMQLCGVCGDLPLVPKMNLLCADKSDNCAGTWGLTYDLFCEKRWAKRNCKKFCRYCVYGGCAYGFELLGERCYKFGTTPLTGGLAINMCESLNSNMLTLETQGEADLIEDYLLHHHSNVTSWRIGGYKDADNQWHWSKATPISEFNKWKNGRVPTEPTLLLQKQGVDSGQYAWVGQWWGSAYIPNVCHHPFICETERLAIECEGHPRQTQDMTSQTASECSPGYSRLGRHCYKFHSEVKQQGAGAIQTCSKEGGYLLRLEDKTENDMIEEHLMANYRNISQWRIGGIQNQKGWFWTPTSPIFCFSNWKDDKVPIHPTLLMKRETPDSPYKWVGEWWGSASQLPRFAYNFICERDH